MVMWDVVSGDVGCGQCCVGALIEPPDLRPMWRTADDQQDTVICHHSGVILLQ